MSERLSCMQMIRRGLSNDAAAATERRQAPACGCGIRDSSNWDAVVPVVAERRRRTVHRATPAFGMLMPGRDRPHCRYPGTPLGNPLSTGPHNIDTDQNVDIL